MTYNDCVLLKNFWKKVSWRSKKRSRRDVFQLLSFLFRTLLTTFRLSSHRREIRFLPLKAISRFSIAEEVGIWQTGYLAPSEVQSPLHSMWNTWAQWVSIYQSPFSLLWHIEHWNIATLGFVLDSSSMCLTWVSFFLLRLLLKVLD